MASKVVDVDHGRDTDNADKRPAFQFPQRGSVERRKMVSKVMMVMVRELMMKMVSKVMMGMAVETIITATFIIGGGIVSPSIFSLLSFCVIIIDITIIARTGTTPDRTDWCKLSD